MAVATSDGYLDLWTQHVARARLNIGAGAVDIAFSPDSKLIALDTESEVVFLEHCDVAADRAGALGQPQPRAQLYQRGRLQPGRHAARHHQRRRVRPALESCYRQAGRELAADPGTFAGVNAVVFSPDGVLASADVNGFVRLWDPAYRTPLGAAVTGIFTPRTTRGRPCSAATRTAI